MKILLDVCESYKLFSRHGAVEPLYGAGGVGLDGLEEVGLVVQQVRGPRPVQVQVEAECYWFRWRQIQAAPLAKVVLLQQEK